MYDKICKVCSDCCVIVGIYMYMNSYVVCKFVCGLRKIWDVGWLDLRKCKRKKNNNNNKLNFVLILLKYCFKNWDVDLFYSVWV